MARQAEALAGHDLTADLDHVGRRHVAADGGVLGRLHLLLGHHLADIGVEPRRGDDEGADPDNVRNPHVVVIRLRVGGGAARQFRRGSVAALVGAAPFLEIWTIVQARDPEHEANQGEEQQHGHRDDLRREAERRREGVR